MGTNYYVDADPTCNNPAHTTQLHIGKSSWGWEFGFRAYPDLSLASWAQWRVFLQGRTIVDEYDETVTYAEFVAIVEDRRVPEGRDRLSCRVDPDAWTRDFGFGGRWRPDERTFHDPEGYDFYNGEFC